ncbi:hypothetical protein, partial [Escherichia coli]|uniref:hypothetical protein n=1 Tax=Escherichia coli TaxID=562 RepID=UPI00359493EB
MEEFSKLLGIPVLDQKPFTGLEKELKPEVVAAALHLKKSDIVLETRSGVKGILAKVLVDKA